MAKIDSKHMTKTAITADGKIISKEEGKKDQSEEGRFYWWKADEQDMAKEIQGTIKFINNHQSTRLEQLTVSTRLYGNSSAFNFIGPALSRSASVSANSNSNRISFNLVASVIDTLVAKMAKNKVIPTYITSGGIWGMQQKAEQLSKFSEGMSYEQDLHIKTIYSLRDSGMWGTGILHVFEDEDEVCVERAFPHEFLIDQVESLTGNPRQLHRVKPVDRDIVLAMIDSWYEDGEEKTKIMDAVKSATASAFIDLGGVGTAADLVIVTESFHLKSGKKGKDGLHVMCVGDTVIMKEEYEDDYFPYPMIHYCKRPLGFWGIGAAERLQNLQGEVNRLMILIQRSMWMGGSFKVLIENGSRVVSQHVNNDVGALIFYTGTPPQYVTPPMIQQDIYPYVDSLIAKGFQQEGVSQLEAASVKPMGVNSGKGLRTMTDIADDRFLFLGQQMEEFTLEVHRQMIEVAKKIYARKKSFKVVFPQTKFLETIDWADIKLKDDEYVLRAYPTSSLPDDPVGRYETIQEWMQAGLVSPRAGRRLMAMPDVEMSDKLANAAEDLLHKIYEEILNDGKYVSPEPQFDLQLASQLYLSYYNYAKLNNAPEDRMDLLREFKAQLDDLMGLQQQALQGQQAIQTLQQLQAQQQQQQQAEQQKLQQVQQNQQVKAMANPTPTPTSPLLQNTNNAPEAQ